MSALCDELRTDLHRYADGELYAPGAIERVRRHLDSCGACRLVLAEHDALVRRILADAASASMASSDDGVLAQDSSLRRRERWLERLALEPTPVVPTRRAAVVTFAAWSSIAAAAAALLFSAIIAWSARSGVPVRGMAERLELGFAAPEPEVSPDLLPLDWVTWGGDPDLDRDETIWLYAVEPAPEPMTADLTGRMAAELRVLRPGDARDAVLLLVPVSTDGRGEQRVREVRPRQLLRAVSFGRGGVADSGVRYRVVPLLGGQGLPSNPFVEPLGSGASRAPPWSDSLPIDAGRIDVSSFGAGPRL